MRGSMTHQKVVNLSAIAFVGAMQFRGLNPVLDV